MRLKTFVANDMKEALAAVRAELGENAVILASQRARGGGILVRAATEDLPNETPQAAAAAEPARPAPEPAPDLAPFEARYHDGLVARLRAQPEAKSAGGKGARRLPFDRAMLLAILGANRTPDALAHLLAEEAEKSQLPDLTLALASALDARMRSAPVDLRRPAALLLAGPNGAGKTAVAAKLGAHARLARQHVRFAATDTAGAGALARLETLAVHLGSPVVAIENAADLAEAVALARKEGEVLIADSAGFDPREPEAWRTLLAFANVEGVETLGVVSATTDAEEAGEIAAALGRLCVGRLIVTGLDLTRRRGTLVALALSGLAIAQVTRSAFVAGGLEPLTPLALARLLVTGAGGHGAARTEGSV